jgi:hypothetical protein
MQQKMKCGVSISVRFIGWIKKHRIKIIVFTVNLLILGVCMRLWLKQPPPGFPVVFTVPDGTRFSLDNMESKSSVYQDEISIYQELLNSLPESWQKQGGFPPPTPMDLGSPALIISYQKHSLPGPSIPRYQFRLIDDCGDELHDFGQGLWAKKPQTFDSAYPLIFQAYAPGSKWFKLQIWYANDPDHRVIKEVVLKNKFFQPPSTIVANPVPQQVTNGPFVVTLTKAVWRPRIVTKSESYEFQTGGQLDLALNLEMNGHPSSNWYVQWVESKTANGSHSSSSRSSGSIALGTNFSFIFQNVQRPREPVRFTAYAQQHGWSSNEVWASPPIAVATNGSFLETQSTNNFLAHKIIILGSVARGTTPPWRTDPAPFTAIDVKISGLPVDLGLIVIGVKDENGNPLHSMIRHYPSKELDEKSNHYTCEFEATNHLRFVTLQLAIRHHKEFEFLVQPEL